MNSKQTGNVSKKKKMDKNVRKRQQKNIHILKEFLKKINELNSTNECLLIEYQLENNRISFAVDSICYVHIIIVVVVGDVVFTSF